MSIVLLKGDNKLTLILNVRSHQISPAAERFAPLQFAQIVRISGLFCSSFWWGWGYVSILKDARMFVNVVKSRARFFVCNFFSDKCCIHPLLK